MLPLRSFSFLSLRATLIPLQALIHDRQNRKTYQLTARGTIEKVGARDCLLHVVSPRPPILDVLHHTNDDSERKFLPTSPILPACNARPSDPSTNNSKNPQTLK